jgi:ketosteroid isomerase-like protein
MKYLLGCVLFIVVATTAIAQSNDEKAVRAVLQLQTTAWNNGNIDAFMQSYWKNDSLLFVGKTGPTYGWQNTLRGYKKRYPDTTAMGKLQFELLQLKPLGTEYYFVLGKFHLTRSIGDLSGIFTLVFRKVGGKWVIISDHTSAS